MRPDTCMRLNTLNPFLQVFPSERLEAKVCVALPKESKPSLERGIEAALHSKRDSLPHVICVRYARLILLTEALGRSPGSFVF